MLTMQQVLARESRRVLDRARKSIWFWDSANVRQSKLYFDYTVPLLEKMTAVAKLGAKEYFIYYESIRPREEKELLESKKAA
jgi:hypothetical protein